MTGDLVLDKDIRVDGEFDTGFFGALNNDSINYPEELPGYFEYLWEKAKEDGLTHEQVQQAITELANWVSLLEKHSPCGVFQYYK